MVSWGTLAFSRQWGTLGSRREWVTERKLTEEPVLLLRSKAIDLTLVGHS